MQVPDVAFFASQIRTSVSCTLVGGSGIPIGFFHGMGQFVPCLVVTAATVMYKIGGCLQS